MTIGKEREPFDPLDLKILYFLINVSVEKYFSLGFELLN